MSFSALHPFIPLRTLHQTTVSINLHWVSEKHQGATMLRKQPLHDYSLNVREAPLLSPLLIHSAATSVCVWHLKGNTGRLEWGVNSASYAIPHLKSFSILCNHTHILCTKHSNYYCIIFLKFVCYCEDLKVSIFALHRGWGVESHLCLMCMEFPCSACASGLCQFPPTVQRHVL